MSARHMGTSPDDGRSMDVAARVVLRPMATPLPLAFLALTLATTTFSAVQLGWVPVTAGREAALTALAAAVLQLAAALMGFQARDPVAGTGVALQSATWAVLGSATLLSPPGSTSPGLGVLLLAAGGALLVPAAAGSAKPVPAAVLACVGARFGITGGYELTAAHAWRLAAGWAGLAVAAVALYAALALELEGAYRRTVLPLGRRGLAASAVRGEDVFDAGELTKEPGVRPRL